MLKDHMELRLEYVRMISLSVWIVSFLKAIVKPWRLKDMIK